MEKKGKVKITSKLSKELSTGFEMDGVKYIVMTEDTKPFITTQVYGGGQVLKSSKTDYTAMLKAKDLDDKVKRLMEKQHQEAINKIKSTEKAGTMVKAEAIGAEVVAEVEEAPAEQLEPARRRVKSAKGYMEDVKILFARKNYRGAIALLDEALHFHPKDAFLQSYRGCLDAVVDKNYKSGIKMCKSALDALKKDLPFGQEFYLPTLYLNLGRAHLAAAEKSKAVKAFSEGLKLDPGNKDLTWEVRKLGERKSPPIAFLSRSNPINKYIGMALHKMKK